MIANRYTISLAGQTIDSGDFFGGGFTTYMYHCQGIKCLHQKHLDPYT